MDAYCHVYLHPSGSRQDVSILTWKESPVARRNPPSPASYEQLWQNKCYCSSKDSNPFLLVSAMVPVISETALNTTRLSGRSIGRTRTELINILYKIWNYIRVYKCSFGMSLLLYMTTHCLNNSTQTIKIYAEHWHTCSVNPGVLEVKKTFVSCEVVFWSLMRETMLAVMSCPKSSRRLFSSSWLTKLFCNHPVNPENGLPSCRPDII